MSSGPPSPRLPIAGSPAAIASTNATPNGSSTPGITNRSHAAARATASGFGSWPTNRTRSATPNSAASRSSPSRHGPSPITR